MAITTVVWPAKTECHLEVSPRAIANRDGLREIKRVIEAETERGLKETVLSVLFHGDDIFPFQFLNHRLDIVPGFNWLYKYVHIMYIHKIHQLLTIYALTLLLLEISIFTQPLRSGRIWHKVNFLNGV